MCEKKHSKGNNKRWQTTEKCPSFARVPIVKCILCTRKCIFIRTYLKSHKSHAIHIIVANYYYYYYYCNALHNGPITIRFCKLNRYKRLTISNNSNPSIFTAIFLYHVQNHSIWYELRIWSKSNWFLFHIVKSIWFSSLFFSRSVKHFQSKIFYYIQLLKY